MVPASHSSLKKLCKMSNLFMYAVTVAYFNPNISAPFMYKFEQAYCLTRRPTYYKAKFQLHQDYLAVCKMQSVYLCNSSSIFKYKHFSSMYVQAYYPTRQSAYAF